MNLRRAEAVNVDLRITLPDGGQKLLVPGQRQFGMHAALQQNLIAPQRDRLLDKHVFYLDSYADYKGISSDEGVDFLKKFGVTVHRMKLPEVIKE
ncbi:MAG: hypothetical protein ACLQQ4_12080, partial [Bacteroidia bacterium]